MPSMALPGANLLSSSSVLRQPFLKLASRIPECSLRILKGRVLSPERGIGSSTMTLPG